MKKKLVKVIVCICLVMALMPISVSAATPTEPYTHQTNNNQERQIVYSRDVYSATRQIHATSLGIEKLSGITDIHCAEDGTIYLLCGDDSRLVILDSHYEFIKELEIRKENGSKQRFAGAQGIFVNEANQIFIADTMNNRVLLVDSEGVVRQELRTPKADVIPDDFYFQPTKVIEDEEGYLYVLSMGCYNGILLYSEAYEFLGFYGASEVESTILDTLSYLWELLTSNDEKKSQQAKVLPYTAIDVAIDNEGFIYTCTGSGNYTELGKGQIRKISPGGSNILSIRKQDGTASASSNYNFFEEELTQRLGRYRGQQIAAVDVSDSNYMFALDATYGKVYMYDQDCNLITVVGGGVGTDSIVGTFATPVAMAVHGNDILVADSKNCSLTLFQLTDFGKTLLEAQSLYYNSEYTAAKPYWEEIVAQDGNNVLAYKGLARAYYAEGNIDAALTYSKLSLDYVTYDYAHQERIMEFVAEHFVIMFLLALLLVAGLVVVLLKIRKRETPLLRNPKLHCFTSTLFHPFLTFHDVKYKKLGSMKIAIVMTACLMLSATLKDTGCGFLFNRSNAQDYNMLFTIAQTVGLLILWSVVNWAVCTVMGGKGRLKEIYIVSAYAMLPLVIYNVVFMVLSHVMTLESVEILTSIQLIAFIYAFFILSVGMMAIHEYDFPKFLLTSIVTVLLMFLVVFIGFILVILLQQFGNFLYSLFMEVVYR